MALRFQGGTTPKEQNFTVHNPAPQGPKLPALRAEVAEPGHLRPRLFLLPFFHTGPAPCPRTRRPRIFVQTGENSLIPLLGLFPPNPLPLGFGGSPLVSRCRPQFASKTLFGTATLPSPSSGHTAAHRGKQRGNSWRCLFLCIAYQFLIWVSFQNTHQRRTPGSPERVTGCSSICFHL